MNSFRKHNARIRMLAVVEDPMHACEELEGYASAHGKDDFYEQLSALMAGCDLAPAALSDALAPLADSARVETDQSDQQIEGPSSVAANTPASLADSDSAAGNVPALCAGEQSMCLTSVAGNAPTSLAGSFLLRAVFLFSLQQQGSSGHLEPRKLLGSYRRAFRKRFRHALPTNWVP